MFTCAFVGVMAVNKNMAINSVDNCFIRLIFIDKEMFLSKKVGICFNCNKLLLFQAEFNIINDSFTQLNNLFK